MNTEKKKMPIIVIGDPHLRDSNLKDITEKLKDFPDIKVIGTQEMSEEDIRTAIYNGYEEDVIPMMVLTANKHEPPPFFSEKQKQSWQKGFKKYF